MTDEQTLYRRVLRRELHAPRTAPAVAVAAIVAVLAVALVAAGVWWMLDASFRSVALGWFEGVAGHEPLVAGAGGVVLILLAVVLLALAVLPGRRPRRARTTARTALLVDDGVIADAVAAAVAGHAGVDRSRVAVTVARRVVAVRITPTSGVPVDSAAVKAAAEGTLATLGFSAAARVSVAERGVIA